MQGRSKAVEQGSEGPIKIQTAAISDGLPLSGTYAGQSRRSKAKALEIELTLESPPTEGRQNLQSEPNQSDCLFNKTKSSMLSRRLYNRV